MKTCTKCLRQLDESSFTIRKSRNNSLHSWCKQCTQDLVTKCRHKLKQQAIDYKGGKCSICGYSKSSRALSFHHTDPSKKDFGISKKGNITFDKIKDELDKCELLCMNCHMELHDKINGPEGN